MKIAATICLCLISGCGFASAAGATTGQDPNFELHAIFDTLVTPAAKTANDAVALAASDPVKSCQMAKDAAASLVTAQTRLKALHDQASADGFDVSAMEPSVAKVDAGVPQFQNLAASVCSGEVAKVQTNPQTKDMADHIGGYVKTYTDDVFAADAALKSGDMAVYCQSAQDGKVQLDGLSTYLADLRKTTSFAPGDEAALDHLGDQIVGFRASNDQRLLKCRAGPGATP